MSYTSRPPFASGMQNSGQNQQQQGQPTASNITPSGVPNMPMVNNPAPTMQSNNHSANPSGSSSMSVIEQQKLIQQQLILQTQLLLQQQQQQQQSAQTQQAKFQQQANAQANLNRLMSDMQKNGNFQQQQLQQLVQFQTLNMIQQQVQAAQQAHQQQKSFQQQSVPVPVPLPSNTTITPVGRQNVQMQMQKQPTNYPRSNVSNKNLPQTLSSTQSRKNLPINTKPSSPSIPPGINPLLNISTVTPKAYAESLASKPSVNLQPSSNITPSLTITRTSSLAGSSQMTKPIGGLINKPAGNVYSGNLTELQRPSIPEAISLTLAANAVLSAKTSQASPSVSLTASNKSNVPASTKYLPITPQKLNIVPQTSVSVQKLSPTSPRTKQTPRKNTNPTKTTASPGTLPTSSQTHVSQINAKSASSQPPATNITSAKQVAVAVSAPSTTINRPKTENIKVEVAKPKLESIQKESTIPMKEVKAPVCKVEEKSPIVPSTPKNQPAPNGSSATKVDKAPSDQSSSTEKPTIEKSVPSSDSGSVKAPVEKETAVTTVQKVSKPDSVNKTVVNNPPSNVPPKSSENKSKQTDSVIDSSKIEESPVPAITKTPLNALSASTSTPGPSETRAKRNRLKTIPYQSPTPEFELVSKISAIEANNLNRNTEEKLTLFYKNEFLAVRNADGGFFLCQTMYNVYKTSPKIRIRWLSEETSKQNIFGLDFYDSTDMDCVLTSVSLNKLSKGKFELTKAERDRIENILKRALDVEKGIVIKPEISAENPDGLDISLYKDESQIEKKSPKKRKSNDKAESGSKHASSATKRKSVNKKTDQTPQKKAKQSAGKSISKKSPEKALAQSAKVVESTPTTSKRALTKRKLVDETETVAVESKKSKFEQGNEVAEDSEPSQNISKSDKNTKQESESTTVTTAAVDSAAQSVRPTRRSKN